MFFMLSYWLLYEVNAITEDIYRVISVYIHTQRKALTAKLRSMYWLIGKKSVNQWKQKSGIKFKGTSSNSNTEILERFQTKAMKTMFNIPKCINNKYILHDLKLNIVQQEIAPWPNTT